MIRGWRRITNVVAVTALFVGTTPVPPAQALTPPVVDNSRLPPPARPAPPQPTTQRANCTEVPQVRIDPDTNPLRGLDLESLGRLSHGDGQRVAVIDTGVNPHPRLAHLEAAGDYVSDGDGTQDCDGHGTVVAGIIAAAADPGDPTHFVGIAPAATLLAIRQSTTKFGAAADPDGVGYGDVNTMARAVRTAADLGATVINISSVACAAGPLDDAELGAALAYAVDVKDVVVVTAAGNVGGVGQCPRQSDPAEMGWANTTVAVSPAWYDDYVLTVGSLDLNGAPSAFSLAGPWVDVAAPGENLISLNPGGTGLTDSLPDAGRDAPISGTSFAAPVVSGLAALIRARFPRLTARQVMRRLEATTHRSSRGRDPLVGNGIVDPAAALGSATGTGVSTAAPDPQPDGAALVVLPQVERARSTAMIGVGVCAALVLLALTLVSSAPRWLRPDHGNR